MTRGEVNCTESRGRLKGRLGRVLPFFGLFVAVLGPWFSPTVRSEEPTGCRALLDRREALDLQWNNWQMTTASLTDVVTDAQRIMSVGPLAADLAWYEAQRSAQMTQWEKQVALTHTPIAVATSEIEVESQEWIALKHAVVLSAFLGEPLFPPEVYRLQVDNRQPNGEVTPLLRFYFPSALKFHFQMPALVELYDSAFGLPPLMGSGLLHGLQLYETSLGPETLLAQLYAMGFPEDSSILLGMQGWPHYETLLLGLGYAYVPGAGHKAGFVRLDELHRERMMEYLLLTLYRHFLPREVRDHPTELRRLTRRYLRLVTEAAQNFLRVAQEGELILVSYSWEGLTGHRPVGFMSRSQYDDHYSPGWRPNGPWWLKTEVVHGLLMPREWAAVMALPKSP